VEEAALDSSRFCMLLASANSHTKGSRIAVSTFEADGPTAAAASAALAASARASEPLILRGAVRTWPALHRWAGPAGRQYMARLHGDNEVDIAVAGCSRGSGGATAAAVFSGHVLEARSTAMPFKEFLFPVEAGGGGDSGGGMATSDGHSAGDLYLAQCPLWAGPTGRAALPGLLSDIAVPDALAAFLFGDGGDAPAAAAAAAAAKDGWHAICSANL
jgi:hypothetical protein